MDRRGTLGGRRRGPNLEDHWFCLSYDEWDTWADALGYVGADGNPLAPEAMDLWGRLQLQAEPREDRVVIGVNNEDDLILLAIVLTMYVCQDQDDASVRRGSSGRICRRKG